MTDKIISCPQCGFPRIRDVGNGLYQCDDCGTHFDKYENIVLTNEDWVRTCTTEQLAEILVCMAEDKSELKTVHKENVRKCVEWLKQPHTPKE